MTHADIAVKALNRADEANELVRKLVEDMPDFAYLREVERMNVKEKYRLIIRAVCEYRNELHAVAGAHIDASEKQAGDHA